MTPRCVAGTNHRRRRRLVSFHPFYSHPRNRSQINCVVFNLIASAANLTRFFSSSGKISHSKKHSGKGYEAFIQVSTKSSEDAFPIFLTLHSSALFLSYSRSTQGHSGVGNDWIVRGLTYPRAKIYRGALLHIVFPLMLAAVGDTEKSGEDVTFLRILSEYSEYQLRLKDMS